MAIVLLIEFIYMVKLLFNYVKICIKINGSFFEPLKIKRGIRQGYSLVSYLFIMVVEDFNTIIIKEARLGLIKGIQLPIDWRQQIMVQYTNDKFLTLGKKTIIYNMLTIH